MMRDVYLNLVYSYVTVTRIFVQTYEYRRVLYKIVMAESFVCLWPELFLYIIYFTSVRTSDNLMWGWVLSGCICWNRRMEWEGREIDTVMSKCWSGKWKRGIGINCGRKNNVKGKLKEFCSFEFLLFFHPSAFICGGWMKNQEENRDIFSFLVQPIFPTSFSHFLF